MSAESVRLFKSLKHGSCTDSYHDFHVKGFNPKREPDNSKPGLAEVLKGFVANPTSEPIPYGRVGKDVDADTLREEPAMLNELFHNVTINGKSIITAEIGKEKPTDNIIRSLIENSKTPAGLQTADGAHFDLNGMEGRTGYKLKILNKNGDGNVKAIACNLTTDDYFDFFGTENINLLFDASVINVTGYIKGCKPGNHTLNLKRVVNRELINDPAPKTYEEPEQKVKNPKVNFEIMFEVSKENITYSKNNLTLTTENQYQRDKFFSNFDFCISPISDDRKKLPKTNVDIIGDGGKRIYINDSPHENNNISNCWGRIIQAFKSSAMKHIESAAYFQCKRSGDWLQALSCLDTGRKYSGKISTTPAPLPGNKIILVTHDRVLLWYALFMGVDVLMTYKMPAAGAVEDDSPGDDEVEALGDDDIKCDPTGSQRFMLYFSADKRGETPQQRTARLIKAADANIAANSMNAINTWISQYNTWIQTIKDRRKAAILEQYNTIYGAKAPKDIEKLLKIYYEFTSLDYVPIVSTTGAELLKAYNESKSKIAAAGANKAVAEAAAAGAADAYLSYYNNMLYKSISLPDENSVLMATNAFRRDELYTNMVSLAQPVIPGRGERPYGGLTPKARAIATASYLTQRLPNDLLIQLSTQTESIKTKFFAGRTFLIDTFLPQLLIAVQKAPAAAAAAASADVTDAIKQESEALGELMKTGAAGAVAAAAPAVEQADIAPDASQGTGARRVAIAMTSLGNAFRKFGAFVRDALSGRLVSGFGVQGGGGEPDAAISQLFYALYMRQLMQDLSSFESAGDEDYQYYEALAKVVISCTTDSMRIRDSKFYNKTENIFYNALPNGRWGEDDDLIFFKDELFTKRVAFVARQVALHSIDMATGQIGLIGNTGEIPREAVKEYNKIKDRVNPLNFSQRQNLLIGELRKRLMYPDAPAIPAGIKGAVSLPVKAGLERVTSGPIQLEAKAQTVGGRRTMRRRGGSRGRRVTRKQRGYKKRGSSRRQRN
jgi:hypothetical protein